MLSFVLVFLSRANHKCNNETVHGISSAYGTSTVVFDMFLVSTVIVISWFKVIQRRGVVKRVAVVELSVPSHFSAAIAPRLCIVV